MKDQQSQPLSEWELSINHRGIVTELICSEAPQENGSLLILGAGECNDIEIGLLLDKYAEITLMDIDSASLRAGVSRQNVNLDPRVVPIGGVDLAQSTRLLERYAREPSEQLRSTIMERSVIHELSGLGKHDVIVSTCVLSQLIGKVVTCFEDREEEFVELLKIVRRSHLEIMLNGLHPGGVGILVTDFVSSESLPELLETEDLQTTVSKAIETNNFFHGLNPQMVARVLTESDLTNQLQTLDVTAPWRWVTPLRVYACFAIIFKKNL